MKHPENISRLSELPIDFMGMIFYDKSPRFVDRLTLDDVNILPPHIERVGVFVNADIDFITKEINKYNLDLVQLHGNESPEFCQELNETIPVMKAFSIAEPSDFEQTTRYEGSCSYFLFDTKTPQYGGSGQKFDWKMLYLYRGNTPFLLSGGIMPEDGGKIKAIDHPLLYGVDLNSRFEAEAGLKNIELLKQFIKELKDEQN